MAQENLGTDLFGDPFLAPREGRGRPAHKPTVESRNKVLLCLVRGLAVKDVAAVLGITTPTLRLHYFSELQQRKVAGLRMEMRQLERLNAQAEQGNVGAERELAKRIDALRQRDRHRATAPAPTEAAQKKLGKKASAEKAARDQRGLYEPPAPPSALN